MNTKITTTLLSGLMVLPLASFGHESCPSTGQSEEIVGLFSTKTPMQYNDDTKQERIEIENALRNSFNFDFLNDHHVIIGDATVPLVIAPVIAYQSDDCKVFEEGYLSYFNIDDLSETVQLETTKGVLIESSIVMMKDSDEFGCLVFAPWVTPEIEYLDDEMDE